MARAVAREGLYGHYLSRARRVDHVEYQYALGRVLVHDTGKVTFRAGGPYGRPRRG
jgi:hypothetical protein